MSDETESSPETLLVPAAEPAPRARKTATRARKAAKTAKPASSSKEKPEAPAESSKAEPKTAARPEPVSAITDAPAPAAEAAEIHEGADRQEDSNAVGADWPEPDAESSGGASGHGEGGKRKRRRRKGKGQGGNGPGEENGPVAEIRPSDVPREPSPRPNPQPQQAPRPRIDPDKLTKMAWKIYLAEVSEEGVALIGDNDAKDLSRRCFRLAEIFIEEQSRRR